MKKLLLIVILANFMNANQEFDYEYNLFKKWYQAQSGQQVAEYVYEQVDKRKIFNHMELEKEYRYNYEQKNNVFYLKLKVGDSNNISISKFKNEVERIICQEPFLSAALYTKARLEFSVWNPQSDFYHYKFGYSENSQPNCIDHRNRIKEVYRYFSDNIKPALNNAGTYKKGETIERKKTNKNSIQIEMH